MTAGTAQSNNTGIFDSSSVAHDGRTLAQSREFPPVSVRIFPRLSLLEGCRKPKAPPLNQVISGTQRSGPSRGGLGPVEPVRDVPNGRERHGHTILGHANRSQAPAACFANRQYC